MSAGPIQVHEHYVDIQVNVRVAMNQKHRENENYIIYAVIVYV